MKRVTVCTYDCPDACSLVLERMADGRLRLFGNPESPFTRGIMCAKTRRQIRRLKSPSRVVRPRRKTKAGWQEIGWEDALDLCAERIQRLRGEPAAILHIHSDGAKGVLKEAVGLFFARLGASRIMGSLCDAAGFIAGVEDFGSRENNDIEDLGNAAAIVNWGKDLSRSSIHTAAIVHAARRRGARVLTISPGGDGNGPCSDRCIRIRPGTDRFLAAAIIQRLIEEGCYAAAAAARARQPEKFFELIRSRRRDELLGTCEVAAADAEHLFQCYAMALGWIRGDGHRGRRAFRIATIGRDILAARDPKVRMIWVNGANVVNQAPGTPETVRAFEGVAFKVVVDAFMNDTAERADLVLPCTLMLEQEDVVGSFLHEYVQFAAAVIEPPAEARSDWWIMTELGKRLDPPVLLPAADECLRAALDSPHLDTTLEELKDRGFVRSQRPRIAYQDLRFDHGDGNYRFPAKLHDEPPAPQGYPLRLLTLIRRWAIHSQILPEDQRSAPTVWISPDCPMRAAIGGSGPADLVSPSGRLPVYVRLMPGLHPGTVVYRRGDWMSRGGGANQLIAAGHTDLGGGAPFYAQYVRLETRNGRGDVPMNAGE